MARQVPGRHELVPIESRIKGSKDVFAGESQYSTLKNGSALLGFDYPHEAQAVRRVSGAGPRRRFVRTIEQCRQDERGKHESPLYNASSGLSDAAGSGPWGLSGIISVRPKG